MATKNQLSGGGFQDATGAPLANGYLQMELSQDAQVNGNTQVFAGYTITINLDANGNVVSSPAQSVWPNDVLSPAGTFYNVSAYSAAGQLVWGPNAQQVLTSPSPYNIGAWVPTAINTTIGGGAGAGSVTSVSVVTANGVSGTVANPTTTPAITLALGAITPSSLQVNGGQTVIGTQGTGSALLTFTGGSGSNQVLSTDASGTAMISGVGTGNLVTTIGNNVFTGHNAFTVDQTFEAINAATNILNVSSPALDFSGNYWNGSASTSDVWGMADILGTGTNPTSTLTFTHSGSPGVARVSVPKLQLLSPLTTTSATAGAATALPANPLGYVVINIAGADVKLPYYNL